MREKIYPLAVLLSGVGVVGLQICTFVVEWQQSLVLSALLIRTIAKTKRLESGSTSNNSAWL